MNMPGMTISPRPSKAYFSAFRPCSIKSCGNITRFDNFILSKRLKVCIKIAYNYV